MVALPNGSHNLLSFFELIVSTAAETALDHYSEVGIEKVELSFVRWQVATVGKPELSG